MLAVNKELVTEWRSLDWVELTLPSFLHCANVDLRPSMIANFFKVSIDEVVNNEILVVLYEQSDLRGEMTQ